MRTEVILLALLVILGITNKPVGTWVDESGCQNKPMDVAFIIDTSWHISRYEYREGIDFLEDVVRLWKISPEKFRIAAVSFGNTVNTDTAFGFDKYNVIGKVLYAMDQIEYKPGPERSTTTAMAISYARKQFFVNPRPFSKRIAVVLTSSKPNDFEKTNEEASLLKKQGVEILVIGVGRGISVKELKALVSSPNLFIYVPAYHTLFSDGMILDMSRATCKWCNSRPIDLNFVYDPVQMGQRGIKNTSQFIKNFLNSKYFEDGQIRAGIIAVQAPSVVPLNRYTNPQDILAHFDINTTTDMAPSIGELRTDAFPVNNGGRVNTRKIAVLYLKGKLGNQQKTISELELTTKEGIQIVVIDMDGMNKEFHAKMVVWFDANEYLDTWPTKRFVQYITRELCSIFERFPDSFVDIY